MKSRPKTKKLFGLTYHRVEVSGVVRHDRTRINISLWFAIVLRVRCYTSHEFFLWKWGGFIVDNLSGGWVIKMWAHDEIKNRELFVEYFHIHLVRSVKIKLRWFKPSVIII